MKLTVFHDGCFWCGVIEFHDSDNYLRVYKQTFYTEPSNMDIFEFVLEKMDNLISQEWYADTMELEVAKKWLSKDESEAHAKRSK